MPSSGNQIGFPRRVVAVYLLFCLGAALLLAGGAAIATRAMVCEQAAESALTRIGRISSAIQLQVLQKNPRGVQALLDKAYDEGHLSYAAVVDQRGEYLAHTDRGLIGQQAITPIGETLNWGEIRGTRTTDGEGRFVDVYRLPLRVEERDAGVLLLAVGEPSWRQLAGELLNHASWAIACPLVLIGVGGWWLGRTAAQVAQVESRLARVAKSAHNETPSLELVTPSSLASIGWNRLVTRFEEMRESIEAHQRQPACSSADARRDAALQSLSDGVLITDPLGRVDFANNAIQMLLGSGETLTGSSFEPILRELAPEQAERLLDAGVEAEVIAELPLATAAGEKTLRLARSPLSGDEAAGHVWNVRDVTQQKYAEKSRDQFIDTATHELRTPLSNIRAYAETLAMGDSLDVEEQKEFCNTINTEATRLSRFVDDLLSISSLEVGSIGVNRSNTDVRRLLQEAIEKVAPLMRKRSLTFEQSLGEKLGEAKLDKDKVSGMLVNLLGNAAKYTPEGGAVTLTAFRDNDNLRFDVTDTGVGIAPEECEKVFEKFFRSENPDVQDTVGTGLGLPLAREIARLHRGDLSVTSTLGEGSTFTATLPVS